MARHTSTPWSRRREQIVNSSKTVVARITDNISHGCDCPTPSVAEANAAFIVEAVNAYASLRAKLEIAEKALEPFAAWMTALDDEFNDHDDAVICAGRGGTTITFGNLRSARSALVAIREGETK